MKATNKKASCHRGWRCHVTQMNASCHTDEYAMSHTWKPHTWKCHVTQMKASYHTYECVMSHVWICNVTHMKVTHMKASCHTDEGVISHIWMRHVTRMFFAMSHTWKPPAPMNHVKYWRASPAEMPFRNWYTANTNHFRLTDFCQVEMKNPTRLSNKTSTAWSCVEDQILENKNLRNMILNICTER